MYKEELIPIVLKIPKSWKEWNTPKFILQSYNYPDTKTKSRHYKKKERERERENYRQTSVAYKCNNPQQSICKPHTTIYKQDHIPWSIGIYSKEGHMLHYSQINQCEKPISTKEK